MSQLRNIVQRGEQSPHVPPDHGETRGGVSGDGMVWAGATDVVAPTAVVAWPTLDPVGAASPGAVGGPNDAPPVGSIGVEFPLAAATSKSCIA